MGIIPSDENCDVSDDCKEQHCKTICSNSPPIDSSHEAKATADDPVTVRKKHSPHIHFNEGIFQTFCRDEIGKLSHCEGGDTNPCCGEHCPAVVKRHAIGPHRRDVISTMKTKNRKRKLKKKRHKEKIKSQQETSGDSASTDGVRGGYVYNEQNSTLQHIT